MQLFTQKLQIYKICSLRLCLSINVPNFILLLQNDLIEFGDERGNDDFDSGLCFS